MNLPKHIAIIPDGNRRWAKKKGLPSFFGHREGARTTEKILRAALDLKIPYFTFWGCSVNNITKRSKTEVKFLLKLFENYFKKLARTKEVHLQKVKIDVIGRWRELFPEKVKQAIEEVIIKTKDYQKFHLTFLMAYSGIEEIAAAIQGIAELILRQAQGKIFRRGSGQGINEKLIKNNLWTKDLPAVDLMIRTGGEPHNSNGFMMWDAANAQLYFTETLWPDFSEGEFKKAIKRYSNIERRMGK